MRRKLAVLCGTVLPMLFLAGTSPARAQDARAQDEKDKLKSLLGAWSLTVTPAATSVCGGAALPSPPPFTELVTFSGGGSFQETNTQLNWNVKPLFPGLVGSASDGFGTWKRRGSQTQVRFRKLVFDATGLYLANATIDVTLEQPERERLSGKFTIKFTFLNGSPSICAAGNVAGVPIRPEDEPPQ